MTRPRTPGVGDDHVAPPPEDEVRQLAGPGEADERPELVGVVGGGEQVGRTADAHRREPRERLVARGLDADPALDVGAGRDGVEGRDHVCAPRASRSIVGGVGERRARGRGQDQVRDRVGRPGRPSARAAADMRACATGIVEDRRRVDERVGVERLVLDQPGGARLDQAQGIGPLVTGRVRVRDDDHRQPERGHLGQGRRARPADDEVRCDQRREHLVAQERIRPVAATDRLRQRFASGQRRRVAVVAGHVDDRHPLDESRQRLGDGGVEPPDRLRPAEDQEHPIVRTDVHPRAARPPGRWRRRPGWASRSRSTAGSGRPCRASGRSPRRRRRAPRPAAPSPGRLARG